VGQLAVITFSEYALTFRNVIIRNLNAARSDQMLNNARTNVVWGHLATSISYKWRIIGGFKEVSTHDEWESKPSVL